MGFVILWTLVHKHHTGNRSTFSQVLLLGTGIQTYRSSNRMASRKIAKFRQISTFSCTFSVPPCGFTAEVALEYPEIPVSLGQTFIGGRDSGGARYGFTAEVASEYPENSDLLPVQRSFECGIPGSPCWALYNTYIA